MGHLILNVALANMIDRTECLIFLNTPNSISSSDIENESMTSSPWIYSELSMATLFPHRELSEYSKELAHAEIKENYVQNKLNVNYKVRTDKLIDLKFQDILDVIRDIRDFNFKSSRHSLDCLYMHVGLIDKIEEEQDLLDMPIDDL